MKTPEQWLKERCVPEGELTEKQPLWSEWIKAIQDDAQKIPGAPVSVEDLAYWLESYANGKTEVPREKLHRAARELRLLNARLLTSTTKIT